MEFIWLVDKSDKIAIQTVEKILKIKITPIELKFII